MRIELIILFTSKHVEQFSEIDFYTITNGLTISFTFRKC